MSRALAALFLILAHAAPAVHAAPAGALEPPTPRQRAQELLDRWLAAQNGGDFNSYQALYHQDFVGVRRSGARAVSLDRDGWLADRSRMFRKQMQVQATNVRIFAKERAARIVFTQVWSSGSYADSGPKQLILRDHADGFRLTREELFASAKAKPATFDRAAFDRFAVVVDGMVVVSTEPDEAWAKGPAKLVKGKLDDLVVRVRLAVDDRHLPAEVKELVGSPLTLMDGQGRRCEAKVRAFELRGQVMTDEVDDAETAWGMSARMLVATVEGDRKACAGATWARAAKLPVPAMTVARLPESALRDRALASFAALAESKAIQKRYARWYASEHPKAGQKTPAWFRSDERGPFVRLMRPIENGPTLISVSAAVYQGGCGEENGVNGNLWGLWELEGSAEGGRLVLRNQPDESMSLRPTAAVDVDGDGRLEILFDSFSDAGAANASGQPEMLEHGFVRALRGEYVEVQGLRLPIIICPC